VSWVKSVKGKKDRILFSWVKDDKVKEGILRWAIRGKAKSLSGCQDERLEEW
jgi:hypothetical protein